MILISLNNVSFGYDSTNNLFDGISVVFNNTDKIAIIGDNGCGKTSLLKMLAGQINPDNGNISRNANVYMLNQMNTLDSRSGGEQQSYELARAFDSGADILLLDEPTNNLDIDARQKFFNDLMAYPFGVVVVSHDRELLQKMDKIIELQNGKIKVYGGNYDFYVAQKNAEQENILSKYVNAQKEIARLNNTMNIAQNTRQHHEAKQKKEIASHKRSRLEANSLKGKSQETEAKKRAIIQKKLSEQFDIQQNLSEQMRNDKIKIPLPNKTFYSKELVQIKGLSFSYGANKIFDNLKTVNFELKMNLVCDGFHQGPITSMDVALQRPIIVTTSKVDKTVRVWNFLTGHCEYCKIILTEKEKIKRKKWIF